MKVTVQRMDQVEGSTDRRKGVIAMIETFAIAGAAVALGAAGLIAKSILSHNRRLPA